MMLFSFLNTQFAQFSPMFSCLSLKRALVALLCLNSHWSFNCVADDSGGPLIIADYGGDGQIQNGLPQLDIITGITSFGDSCAEGVYGAATAYIALHHVVSWIRDTVLEAKLLYQQTLDTMAVNIIVLLPHQWTFVP